jgi:probable phosphoglycerate mutase
MDPNATEKWQPPPRRRVYLMRHGEVDYFAPDGRPLRPETVTLNAEGRRQAEVAGRLLADVPLDRVVTSGLPRSVETVRLVLGPRGLPLEVRPDLREIETGPLRMLGEPISRAVEQAFVNALHGGLTPGDRFLGGETFGALLGRVWPCFQGLLAEQGWRHLLVVAHGVVNLTLLSQVLGAGLAGLGALEQENGCINILDVEDSGRCLVQTLNFTPLNPLKAGMQMTTMERLYLQYRQFRRE